MFDGTLYLSLSLEITRFLDYIDNKLALQVLMDYTNC